MERGQAIPEGVPRARAQARSGTVQRGEGRKGDRALKSTKPQPEGVPRLARLARCTHAFDSTVHAGWKSEHLAMRVGDEVVLEESPDDKNWWKGHVRIRGAGQSGYFPKAFVQRMEPELELQVRCPQCRYERAGPRV